FISSVVGRLDRKILLLALTAVMIVSEMMVAVAPNYMTFMVGRALIGLVIGGFWSISAATAMRLVPDDQVPRALAIFNGGNALATVIAAPLGSFLGSLIGWRGAFFCVVPVAVIVFVWQLLSLLFTYLRPFLETAIHADVSTLSLLLQRRQSRAASKRRTAFRLCRPRRHACRIHLIGRVTVSSPPGTEKSVRSWAS
ncbi:MULTISPECIES: MFS transporter, partial [Sinorhizobium]|uniref:MFS transporter n=1 Tax=Sinorhizobium TaxID=28105 RepID=UPI001F2EB372